MKTRRVEPEILDTLAPNDPAALANRRDILRINRIQGSYQWIAKQLRWHRRAGEPIIELGAGLGDLGREVARRAILGTHAGHYAGLDLWPRPQNWPEPWEWYQADLLTFEQYADYPVVVANLILHQFENDELRSLGATLREKARVFIINEPRRGLRAKWGFRALCLLGANHVTRHDGAVSIRAGFRGNELPTLLGLDEADWQYYVEETLLDAYRLLAIRRMPQTGLSHPVDASR